MGSWTKMTAMIRHLLILGVVIFSTNEIVTSINEEAFSAFKVVDLPRNKRFLSLNPIVFFKPQQHQDRDYVRNDPDPEKTVPERSRLLQRQRLQHGNNLKYYVLRAT